MNKKWFCWILVLFCFVGFGYSQSDENMRTIHLNVQKADQIAVDFLGNLYVLQDANLYKYDTLGHLLFTYSDLMNGAATSVDVSNPMKVMLYYQDAQQLCFLDEHLALISTYDLTEYGFYSVVQAATSSHNRVWLLDPAQQELICTDFRGKVINRSRLSIPDLLPSQMFCTPEGKVVLCSFNTGLFLFDAFGTLVKQLPILTDKFVQVDKDNVYYLKENLLCVYNMTRLEQQTINLSVQDAKQCIYKNDKLFILTEAGEVLIDYR